MLRLKRWKRDVWFSLLNDFNIHEHKVDVLYSDIEVNPKNGYTSAHTQTYH